MISLRSSIITFMRWRETNKRKFSDCWLFCNMIPLFWFVSPEHHPIHTIFYFIFINNFIVLFEIWIEGSYGGDAINQCVVYSSLPSDIELRSRSYYWPSFSFFLVQFLISISHIIIRKWRFCCYCKCEDPSREANYSYYWGHSNH